MNTIKQENFILLIIKYSAPILMIVLSILASSYIYIEYTDNLAKEQVQIKENYLKSNKNRIKMNINRVNNFIENSTKHAKTSLKNNMKRQVYNAHNIMLTIFNEFKDTKSKKEITKIIKTAFKSVRFNNGRGYFFIYNFKGTNVFHPTKPNREGKNYFYDKDIAGVYKNQIAINIVKDEGEGFFNWFSDKPNISDKEYEKIGFVKKFEPYDWFIGTAEYVEDNQNESKKKILEHLKIIKYQDNGYVFVIKNDGTILWSRTNIHNILKTKRKYEFIQKFKDFLVSSLNDSYLEYRYKDDTTKKYLKVSYLHKVRNMDWIIGTGFNLDILNTIIENKQKELEKEYTEHFYTLLFSILIIGFILVILSFYLSKILEKMFYSYHEDIIKQKSMQSNFVMKELQIILDNLPMLILYKDAKNNIVRVNKSFADSVNMNVYEFNNVPSKDIFPLDYEDYYREDLEVINSKEAKIGIVKNYSVKGIHKSIEISKFPILNDKGEVENIIVCIIDITDKLVAEEKIKFQYDQLIVQKEEFETIFNSSKDGIAIMDLESKFLNANESYCQMLGFPIEELLTKSCIGLSVPEDVEKSLNAVATVLKDGFITNFEKRCIRKDDKMITVSLSATLLPDKQRVLIITKDISESKLLEEQSKLASMGEMIGNIAHQWRQPLTVISAASTGTLLHKELGSLKDETLENNLNMINKHAQYLSKTIDDFKNFIKNDKVVEFTSINDAVKYSINLIDTNIKSNFINLVTNFNYDLKINANKNELVQSFMNILNNAIDVLVENTIEENRYIFIETNNINDTLELKISDSGGGIDPLILKRVFEPYFTTKHQSVGTGIGLSMVNKILNEKYKADISVFNTSNTYDNKTYKGACFKIVFKGI